MWEDLLQSLENLKKKTDSLRKKKFSLQVALRLQLQHQISCFSASQSALQNLDWPVPTIVWANSLKWMSWLIDR